MRTRICHGLVILVAALWSLPAAAALLARNLDGNPATAEAYYDTGLGITWLADTNLASTYEYDGDGLLIWADATAWAAALNPYSSGIMGWRLPRVIDTDGPDEDLLGDDGCNLGYSGTDCNYNVDTTTGEMAHLFYVELGNLAKYTTDGTLRSGSSGIDWGLVNTGPFTNFQSAFYWTDTPYAPSPYLDAWYFRFDSGAQNRSTKTHEYYAWAVHDGDVGAAVVPISATAWLFGSGLIGLFGLVGGIQRRG